MDLLVRVLTIKRVIMKKLIFMMGMLLSLGVFSACSSDNDEDSLISQDHAWLIVKTFVLNNQLDKIDVYVSKNTIQPNKTIETYSTPDISPDYESWLFFIDDIPFGNWSHPCRYIYVNAVGGKYEVHQHSMPPMSMGEFTPLVQMPLELIGQ